MNNVIPNKIIAGRQAEHLAKSISNTLDIPLVEREIIQFSDGESYIEIKENLRGSRIFMVQSLYPDQNNAIVEMLLMCDALRNSSVQEIYAILPYYPYARQDRRTFPRSPISARMLAKVMETMWIKHVVTIDLHTTQIQGFFSCPVDNMYSVSLFAEYIKSQYETLPMIFSPDIGGVLRSRALARDLGAYLGIVDKRRPKAGVSEVVHVLGDCEGKDIILYDDIIDSAGTVCNSAESLVARGAKSITVCATHGLFSGPAIERIEKSVIQKVVVTNSMPLSSQAKISNKFEQISIVPMLSHAINSIASKTSIYKWTKI